MLLIKKITWWYSQYLAINLLIIHSFSLAFSFPHQNPLLNSKALLLQPLIFYFSFIHWYRSDHHSHYSKLLNFSIFKTQKLKYRQIFTWHNSKVLQIIWAECGIHQVCPKSHYWHKQHSFANGLSTCRFRLSNVQDLIRSWLIFEIFQQVLDSLLGLLLRQYDLSTFVRQIKETRPIFKATDGQNE